MSTRAIAPIVGVHHDTVAEDRKSPVGNPTPEPAPANVDIETGEIYDEPVKTTGMDGKQYSRSAAPGQSRWWSG